MKEIKDLHNQTTSPNSKGDDDAEERERTRWRDLTNRRWDAREGEIALFCCINSWWTSFWEGESLEEGDVEGEEELEEEEIKDDWKLWAA